MDLVLHFLSHYLIETMGVFLVIGLVFRWASYKKSSSEDEYLTTFSAEVEKVLSAKKDFKDGVESVDKYLDNILSSVKDKLPSRSVRRNSNDTPVNRFGSKKLVSLKEYVRGEKSFFLAIKNESASFENKFPPNFPQLTKRILEKDDKWDKIWGYLPIAPIARLNDVLPSIFVILGILGTFVGISMALPEIAKIDFNNLDASGDILTNFVLSVTYAMKTSIAGICFSLIMTFLNTMAPVSNLRQKTHKKLANCFENIWLSIHQKQNAEQVLAEYLPRILSELERQKKGA